nr:HAD family acid phosphatase [Legionella taurinensis]
MMNTLSSFFLKLFLSFSLLLSLTPSAFAEPPNLSIVKNEIRTYHDSGIYNQELTQAIARAHDYIMAQVKANNHHAIKQKLAIVLDIDETSLSNYDDIIKNDFTADRQAIHQQILKARAPAIKPMLALYKDAIEHGVKVFFVTGRNQSELKATETNLLKAGYKHWAGLYVRPDNYQQQSIVPFKAHARELISKKGYTIIATIGDQYSDLMGGFAKKEFKLPNPFYFLP